MNYRARWIDAAGEVGRDETFGWPPEKHPMWGLTLEEVRELALVLDAPYFNLRELQAHVQGHIEGAWRPWGYFVVNDEGMLRDGWQPNPSPLVNPTDLAALGGWQHDGRDGYIPLFGPAVLVEIVP